MYKGLDHKYKKWNLFRSKRYSFQKAYQKDCENLLLKYSEMKSYSFSAFSNFWKEHNFSLVYCGKYQTCDLGHFTTLIFNTTKKYILFCDNKYIQIGALYVLYGLYFKQPIPDLIRIRLLQPEYCVFRDLIDEMKTLKQYDPLYIFYKLLQIDAFQFTYTHVPLWFGMQYIENDLNLQNDILLDNFVKKKENKNKLDNLIEETYKIEESYNKLLIDYLAENNVLFNKHPLTLKEDLDAILNAPSVEEPSTSSSPETKRLDKKRNIKNKAFSAEVNENWRYKQLNTSADDLEISDED